MSSLVDAMASLEVSAPSSVSNTMKTHEEAIVSGSEEPIVVKEKLTLKELVTCLREELKSGDLPLRKRTIVKQMMM